MRQVKVDTGLLIEAGGQLRSIVETLVDANDDAAGLAEQVGHEGLAGKVRDFAENWQSRRREMLEVIGTLGDVSEGVGIAFEEWDRELAASLQRESGAHTTSGRHGVSAL